MLNRNYRRTKVLLFVILLFALNGVYSAHDLNVPDLLHLVKQKGDGNEQLCIGFAEEAYAALEWTYPIPEDENELPKTVSSYLPSESYYGCDFEEEQDCTKVWGLKNWMVPSHTTKNYLPIFDTRWEDFRTYLATNRTKISENRFAIPKNSNIGISIRSGDNAEILLCEGYNPASYPCYTIGLGGTTKKEVYLRKYGSNVDLANYTSDFPILSIDEWKNFNIFVSETGNIQLRQINKDITYLDVTDPKPLDTLYLLLNSTSPALWKIHRNQFLFTNVSQYIPFGPSIDVAGSTLCLSMYLLMCPNCSLYFYKTVDNDKEIVFEIHGTDEENDKISYEWKHIRIIVENVTDTTLQLFIKTNSNASDSFWAVDNIRKCVKNEFKVNRLSKSEFAKTDDFQNTVFSCHSLQFPEWRPKQEILPAAGLPILTKSVSTTSIELYWKAVSPQPYIVKYEGNDICSADTITRFKNPQRMMSTGWIIVRAKDNKIMIDKLIPYTHYVITFIDPVYETNKTLPMSTAPTDKPTENEINKVIIVPNVTNAKIDIPLRKCNISYGPVVYGLNIIQNVNRSRQVLMDQNIYTWNNLQPYTNYTLAVQVARTIKSLDDVAKRIVNYYNFTTKPDVAPALKFVELYEIGENLASFRYKLPAKTNGQPTLVQVRGCANILRECNQNMTTITSCKLWKDLYCVTLKNLIKGTYYTFKLSIRNNNTNAFGNEVNIIKRTLDDVPGTPTNLSYTVIDCCNQSEVCNLNLSWSHPYNQNGVITYFEIFLYGDGSPIMEIALLENGQYSPTYQHQIMYTPYAKTYNVSIRACNKMHKGNSAFMLIQIDHIGQHIDQTPDVLKMDKETITFQIAKLDYRLNSSSVIVVVQQNSSEEAHPTEDFISLMEDGLCLRNKLSWIAGSWNISHGHTTDVTIGNNVNVYVDVVNSTVVNKPLLPNTDYCINFIVNNTYKGVAHIRIYHKEHIVLTEDDELLPVPAANTLSTASVIVLTLLVALVLAIGVFGVVLHRRKLRRQRNRYNGEHIYEPMPSDDHNETYNVVYNAVYDKLNHQ